MDLVRLLLLDLPPGIIHMNICAILNFQQTILGVNCLHSTEYDTLAH